MVKNHPFVDANKRTAFLVTDLFVVRSGYALDLRDGERIDDLVVNVAEDKMAFDELVVWLRTRLVKVPNWVREASPNTQLCAMSSA